MQLALTAQLVQDQVTYLAALPSADGIKNSVIKLLGSVVIIILLVRVVTAYAKKNWGEIVVEIIAAVIIFWFVFFTDNAVNTVKSLVTTIFG